MYCIDVELNVGFPIGTKFEHLALPTNNPDRALRVLADLGLHTMECRQFKDGEPGIWTVSRYWARKDEPIDEAQNRIRRAVYLAASCLGQECIAIRWNDHEGELEGAFAESWGKFDPQYFRVPTR